MALEAQQSEVPQTVEEDGQKGLTDDCVWYYGGNLCQGQVEEFILRNPTQLMTPGTDLAALLGPLPDADVAAYLQAFGYAAADAERWRPVHPDEARPVLTMGDVLSHTEMERHTWYKFSMHITVTGMKGLHWTVERRLVHLREWLHDPVKLQLGAEYKEYFENAPFASHLAPPGTSERLCGWLKALSQYIADGRAKPKLLALLLRFMEAPTHRQPQKLSPRCTVDEEIREVAAADLAKNGEEVGVGPSQPATSPPPIAEAGAMAAGVGGASAAPEEEGAAEIPPTLEASETGPMTGSFFAPAPPPASAEEAEEPQADEAAQVPAAAPSPQRGLTTQEGGAAISQTRKVQI